MPELLSRNKNTLAKLLVRLDGEGGECFFSYSFDFLERYVFHQKSELIAFLKKKIFPFYNREKGKKGKFSV